jgi:hypothetical protein
MSEQQENPYAAPRTDPPDQPQPSNCSLRSVIAGSSAAIVAATATIVIGVAVIRILDLEPTEPIKWGLVVVTMLALFAAAGTASRRAKRGLMSRAVFILLILAALASIGFFGLVQNPAFKDEFVEMRGLREFVDRLRRR